MIINTNLSSLFTNRKPNPLFKKGMDVFTTDILQSLETETVKNIEKKYDDFTTSFSMDIKSNESWKNSKFSATFQEPNTFVFTFFDENTHTIAEKFASFLQQHPSFRIKFVLSEYQIKVEKDQLSAMTDVMARLSSGKRINRSSDEAAGLSVASRMTSQIKNQNEE